MEAPEHLQVMGFEKGKACGDHFMVEDLLDFSNGGAEEGEGEGEGEEELAFDSSSSIVLQNSAESSSAVAPIEYCSSTSPISGPREPHFLGEDLCVPYDELAELEWLSHFVEDSFSADSSSHKLQALPSSTNTITPITTPHKPSTLTATTPANTTANTSNLATTSNLTTTTNAISYTPPSPSPPLFTTDPPVRCARSKRCRSAPRDWASRLLVLTPPTNPIPPEASLLRPPPTPTTHDNHQSSTSSNCPPLPSTKKHSKAPKKHTQQQQHHSNLFEPSLAPNPDGRKCLHCATEKTPQWRTGPMGPKTLCNACGVRYKSGRLVPEYRPAASPTFVLSKHSNSHRKVMELRRQKDLQLHHPPQRGGSSGDHHPTNGNGLFVGNHYRQQQHGAAGGGGDIGGGYCEESDDFLIHNHLGPDFRQLI